MNQLSQTQKELLFRFNTENLMFDSFKPVHAYFEEKVQSNPNQTAVECNGEMVSYSGLNSKANKIANWLIGNGAKTESLIGICCDRSVNMVAAILGVLKSGSAYVPFDPAYPADRISYMLSQSGIKTVLFQEKYRRLFDDAGVTAIPMDTGWSKFESQSDKNPAADVAEGNLAYVLFTSGSTGMPKGVAMVHRALSNLIEWQNTKTCLGTPARTLQFAPVSFDVSFQEMFTTWSVGGTLVLIEDELRLNAIRLLEFIQENNIERLFLPFIALQHLSEVACNSRIWPVCLKDVITAGEQLQITKHVKTLFTELPGCRLHNHYGPTESHVVTALTLDSDTGSWPALPAIGRPVSHTHIYLLDENLQPVPFGEQGEIFIAGASLASGYIGRPDLTAERFLPNPFVGLNDARMYRTGDLGKYLSDGNIEYLGRTDNQVKVRGYRIELGEVEIALSNFPGISQVVVAVREDEPGDKRLVAYFTTEAGFKVTTAEFRKFISGKLPDYMMPSAFVAVDSFPKTPSGKIDRRSLPRPNESRPDIGTLYVEPRSPQEKNLAAVWSQLLRIDKTGIDDNFFDLGGNSLLALQMIARLRQEHSMEVPVVKLYQHPTIKSLLNALEQKTQDASVLDIARKRLEKTDEHSDNTGAADNGIAIIGMAGRFPGADNVRDFWNNLLEGKETTHFFTDQEIDPFIDLSLRNDPSYVKARGIISDADKFDSSFFGVNPRLGELMDPQQRVFLEVCWEGLEDSGYTSGRYKGLIGVFAGMGNNTYYTNNVLHHKDAIDKVGGFQVMVANEKDYIATRISHFMNLKGPGLSVHTACSTSLTAVAMAVQSLRSRHCDMAIAGGVAITSPVNSGHLYQEGGMFSSDGHTRSFDANASGTVFSDGAGVVILKRYSDAVADGDTVYAVIKGIGINNDGSEKASFTAPSVEGQANAIAMAQADAGVSPDTISYIETHGTATPLGDPIEVEALTLAFKGGTNRKQFCAIGSVKSNFGHLTAAAGVTGLIKTAIALRNKVIPASINYSRPNPAIDFENSPFFVNNVLRTWEESDHPRRAGVSSFGVGGTNVHLVLEEAPRELPSGPSRSRHLLLFSAKNNERLEDAAVRFRHFIAGQPELNLADAAFTLQTGRAYFNARKFIVCDSVDQAAAQLNQPQPAFTATRQLEQPASGVAFMFPGQGSQYVNMGAVLYRDEIVFREAVDRCCDILIAHLGTDLRTVLYPAKGEEETATRKLQETAFTQPALFTIGYALSRLWMSWGIQPAVLTGHSIGEFCAACISGIMSLDDALMLVANRGRMMQELPGGSMLSVKLSAEEVKVYLSDDVSVAAVNGPSLCVISGPHESVESINTRLEAAGVVCRKLHTSHAFHSPMMDSIVDPFRKLVEGIKLNPPSIPVVSTATAGILTPEQATDPSYWAMHLRLPVRFADAVKAIWEYDRNLFLLELGPRNTASTLARQQATDLKKQFACPSLPDTAENDAEWNSMLYAIGQLWLSGISISWSDFYALEQRKHISLPAYPFERKRYWVDPSRESLGVNTFHPYQPFGSELPDFGAGVDFITQNQLTQDNMSTVNRKQRIISELRNVMEEASGIELASADDNASFMELGMDSLFLTQAALTISKKYGTKITFRQLNENFSSLGSLAAHIDSMMPAEPEAPVQRMATSAQQMQTVPAAGNASSGNLQWLIMQQMQIMQQQLAVMSGVAGHAVPVQSTPAVPVAPTAPAASTSPSESEKAELEKPFGAIARIEKVVSAEMTDSQKKWLKNFTEEYNRKTARSKSYTQDNRSHLADPRVVTGFKPTLKELIYQAVVERSEGCRMWDIDGNEYIDVLNGFGSNFLGYGNRMIMNAVEAQLKSGIELGPQHPLAGEMARLICEFTGYDRAGLCNTGSEAVLGAMRIARTVTGRTTIVCFNGSYHGINDEVIVRGTKKLKSFPAAAGIPAESVQNMLVLDYGTEEALEIIRQRSGEIAAVLVEPIQSRRADFRPKEFLHEVRKITQDNGALLIFDEVITGFRLLPGGAQEFYGIKADLSTYGKVIGGGMPIGAIAGRREYMDALDGGFWQFGDNSVPEVGVTYFAGTFVRHPLALAAGVAVLHHLKERGMEIYHKLNGYTDKLVNEVNAHCARVRAPFHLVSFGSLWKLKWDVEHPYGELIFLLMRHKGIHIYDGFPCFFTDAFSDKDVDTVISRFKEVTDELMSIGFLTASDTGLNGHQHNGRDKNLPPVEGARLGKDPQGNPGWYIPDPDRPGKFKQVFHG